MYVHAWSPLSRRPRLSIHSPPAYLARRGAVRYGAVRCSTVHAVPSQGGAAGLRPQLRPQRTPPPPRVPLRRLLRGLLQALQVNATERAPALGPNSISVGQRGQRRQQPSDQRGGALARLQPACLPAQNDGAQGTPQHSCPGPGGPSASISAAARSLRWMDVSGLHLSPPASTASCCSRQSCVGANLYAASKAALAAGGCECARCSVQLFSHLNLNLCLPAHASPPLRVDVHRGFGASLPMPDWPGLDACLANIADRLRFMPPLLPQARASSSPSTTFGSTASTPPSSTPSQPGARAFTPRSPPSRHHPHRRSLCAAAQAQARMEGPRALVRCRCGRVHACALRVRHGSLRCAQRGQSRSATRTCTCRVRAADRQTFLAPKTASSTTCCHAYHHDTTRV